MKKVIIYFLSIVLLCFLIPILFTHKNNFKNYEKIEQNTDKTYDYGIYNQVNLLHTKTRRGRTDRIR